MKTQHLGIAALALWVGIPALAHAQMAPAGEPIVQLGIFVHRPDGTTGSSTYATSDQAQFTSQLYIAPCSLGSTRGEKELAYAVWKVDGKVLDRSDQVATVQVTWQRMRVAGQSVTEQPTVQVVAAERGRPIQLDATNMPAAGACPAQDAALEVRYAPRPIMPTASAGGRPQAVVSGGGRGGGGVANGPVAGTTTATSSGGGAFGGVVNVGSSGSGATATSSSGTGGGGGGGVMMVARSGNAGATDFRPFRRVTLWLVHSAPALSDEVLQTSTTATPSVGAFAFPPLTIQTPTGLVSVSVTGTVEVGLDAAGTPKFVFGATRRVSFAPSNRPARDRDSAITSEGVARSVRAVPGPEEVLSFEMPTLAIPGGGTLQDKLSIRIQLTQ